MENLSDKSEEEEIKIPPKDLTGKAQPFNMYISRGGSFGICCIRNRKRLLTVSSWCIQNDSSTPSKKKRSLQRFTHN